MGTKNVHCNPMTRDVTGVAGVCICLLAGVVCLVCLSGCIQPAAREDSRMQVAVTILPQAEIAGAIGGEKVCVTVVVPPGADPHTYEPSAAQLVAISGSDIYLRLGPGLMPFEDILVTRLKDLNPDLLIIDTSAGISLIRGNEGDGGTDPHIWLSPANLRIMAGNTGEGLSEADPAHAEYYASGTDAYMHRIDSADRTIAGVLSGLEGEAILVFHPAWGYFAREYDLEQVAVETEGKEPGAQHISSLIDFAREKGIRVIFADPRHSTRESEVIAREIHGTVVLLNPLAPDTLDNLERVAAAIAGGYGNQAPGDNP